MNFNIYMEGFVTNGESGKAIFLATSEGDTFIEACKNYIKKTGHGEIRVDKNGNEYASYWGCRWFPTLEEAQEFCG